MIVGWIGIDRDLVTLKNVRGADNTFCCLSRKESYRNIDFRGKSPAAIRLFAEFIAPKYGSLTTSIIHRPIDEDAVERSGERLSYCRERDKEFASVFGLLHNVVSVDLTVPTLEFQPLYGLTMAVLVRWKLRSLTCRSKNWGRGNNFVSATDAFNAKSLVSPMHPQHARDRQLMLVRIAGYLVDSLSKSTKSAGIGYFRIGCLTRVRSSSMPNSPHNLQ